jgi:hypothetical protein
VGLLNRGLSLAEIAGQSGVSIKHILQSCAKIPGGADAQPPPEYLAPQMSRLKEAPLVFYSATHNSATGTNFEAVD